MEGAKGVLTPPGRTRILKVQGLNEWFGIVRVFRSTAGASAVLLLQGKNMTGDISCFRS